MLFAFECVKLRATISLDLSVWCTNLSHYFLVNASRPKCNTSYSALDSVVIRLFCCRILFQFLILENSRRFVSHNGKIKICIDKCLTCFKSFRCTCIILFTVQSKVYHEKMRLCFSSSSCPSKICSGWCVNRKYNRNYVG